MDENNIRDVVIVGAGPGGLASALLLAQSGLKVTIVEKENMVGGRTRLIEKDGFKFDTGPTFFHFPEVIEDIFQAIGKDAHKELGLVRLDPSYRLVFGQGGSIDVTSDIEEMTQRVKELSGERDAKGFERYISENRIKLERSRNCLNTPWRSPLDLASKRAIRVSKVLKPWRSVAGDLNRLFKDERLHLAMSFQTKYLGMSPFQAPSLFTILAYLEYEHGIFHVMGGLGNFTKRMSEIAQEMGVEILLNHSVDEVLFKGNTAVGVKVNNDSIYAKNIVINADFANAMTKLIPNEKRKKWSDKRLSKKSYSCSTFMMYLGLNKKYEQPHHQIYASANYKENLDDVVNHKITWNDPSIYVQNACVTDPNLAPDGCSTLYVLVPVSNVHDNIKWDENKEKYRDIIISQLSKLGYEDVENHIVSETIITPDDWVNSGIYRGAVFNLAHGLNQMLWRRPQNKMKEYQNLFLVGGGTHPGSGLPTILESAKISSKLICAEMGLNPNWNGVDTWFSDVKLPKHRR